MNRLLPCVAIALLVPALAVAQSLQPVPGAPAGNRDANTLQSAPPPAPSVASRLDERPPASATSPKATPVPSNLDDRQGKTRHTRPASPAVPAAAVADPSARRPVRLYDRSGQVIPGAMQVGPNRALDTRTGRYYDTVPSGDGVRIQE
ncbi:hypothetical protein [Xanthomonas rydalmerensis]|uniref:Classical arabinogalactan protein 4 n=1 Tax=Xanthomonas rydalmerensis TaxID=3046274 RepID=A0ABZ0JLV9_9XANT|nr:hypothetical protein [Xanthomonas sp. DM-2023]WOS40411.1 hypothetical protein QN243_18785 [Xanthomonas sp. DM-2023]WOS44595.1 hypothetical protein QN242_18785 [Xanthomonas sp. DM-2023]WOS48775.1 hypothetical protein QN240_18785 [Xanthomonas sp. DM-2023]WOS52955.1 hypothetical protein QN244_18790 [Xanthomonas sp. DM-2023]WOS57139.1 hypothetical protein QN245_18785 [Xanthomonas sp. DM-2023]